MLNTVCITQLSRGCSDKESACQCRRFKEVQEMQEFNPWVRKMLWSKKWQPTPVFLPGKSCGQRSLAGYSSQSWQESNMTEHTHTQQCVGIPFFPHLLQHLLFIDFLTIAILTSMNLYLIVVFICISLIINNAEHLFMCLLAICMSSLKNFINVFQ